MDKCTSRLISLDELNDLSVVGGNDEGNSGITPYATTIPCSIITVTVVSLVVSQTASCAEVC